MASGLTQYNGHNKITSLLYQKTQQYYIIICILLWQHVLVFHKQIEDMSHYQYKYTF